MQYFVFDGKAKVLVPKAQIHLDRSRPIIPVTNPDDTNQPCVAIPVRNPPPRSAAQSGSSAPEPVPGLLMLAAESEEEAGAAVACLNHILHGARGFARVDSLFSRASTADNSAADRRSRDLRSPSRAPTLAAVSVPALF